MFEPSKDLLKTCICGAKKSAKALTCKACYLNAKTDYSDQKCNDKINRTNNTSLMATKEGHAYKRFHSRKSHAKTNGIEFNITLDYVVSIITDTCPVFGTKLTWCEQGGRSENSPSLDRIKSDLGYVVGNVAWVSNKANRIKNDGNADDHLAIYNWLKGLE